MQETNIHTAGRNLQLDQKKQKSLHDVLLKNFGAVPNPANPFLATVLLCGEKVEDEPTCTSLKTLLDESFMKADSINPFVKESENFHVSGIIIDYEKHILQLVQGPDHNVYSYLSDLKSATNLMINNFIIFFDDDTDKLKINDWVYIDKVPPKALEEVEGLEKSEEEISDSAIGDLFNLIELGSNCIEQSQVQKVSFSDIARVKYPKLFPSINSLMMYKKCKLFFTLDEFVENLCMFPQLTQDCELNYPLEDPLKY
ncbi:unnamed protein product [Phytomonas sp. Hart1]|nr:unnamed protein product [Phytomonas sp. Hart1]|eukprot:CCW65966.1 unnamed protein product [Phytomonas sp. isolate Hart1]